MMKRDQWEIYYFTGLIKNDGDILPTLFFYSLPSALDQTKEMLDYFLAGHCDILQSPLV